MTAQGGNAAPRFVSGLERLWLVADRLHPPFVNQMVIEGGGWPHAGGRWPELMAQIAQAQPALRARLRGHLGRTRWQADGPLAAVREVDGSAWDGQGPGGAPFLGEQLVPRRGPSSEVLLVRGEPCRIVIRTHHALMDGQGTLLLARAIFAVLRGEPAPPAELGPLTDAAIAARIGVAAERIPPSDGATPGGPASGVEMKTTWRRRRVSGKFQAVLPRLALALGRFPSAPAGRPLRVAIPVDLRRHAAARPSSANLTGLLRMDLREHLGTADPIASIGEAIARGAQSGAAAAVCRASQPARWLPLSLMTAVARRDARRALHESRCGSSAVLSNLGPMPLPALSGGGFQARACFFVPPGNPGLPLFLAVAGDPEGVELCACMPVTLASGGRVEALLDALARGLG